MPLPAAESFEVADDLDCGATVAAPESSIDVAARVLKLKIVAKPATVSPRVGSTRFMSGNVLSVIESFVMEIAWLGSSSLGAVASC